MAHEPQTVTIIVEGTPHEWPKNEEISYAQVVTLEVPGYSPNSGVSYAVKYTRGEGHKPEGILSPGESVKVKDGMVFSVSETGQS
jgi:Multiubiquitin